MKSYEAKTSIEASPADVWRVLTDGAGWTSWPSGIERFEGAIEHGARIKLYSEVSPGRAFPLKVVEFVPNERLVFRGGMPLGLFTGERTYSLAERGGRTEFTVREEFSGPLLPIIWKTMPDLGPSFSKFAEGIKAVAEAPDSREDSS